MVLIADIKIQYDFGDDANMKISCPKCNAAGDIPEHDIPEAGRFVSCPRCQQGFTVMKPRASKDAYLVDTCPSCNFSTFGDEPFGTCPRCGVVVKAFVERQRDDLQQQKNQELLSKKFNRNDDPPITDTEEAPANDFLENLHPVNLIGWGIALAAVVIVGLGLFGVFGYDGATIQARLSEQRDEHISGWYVFLHYGLMHWVKLFYGLFAMAGVFMLIKHLRMSLKFISWLIWIAMAYVPASHIISFVYWVLAPIPHTIAGYFIEVFNIAFMSALVGIPLYLLERYLHDRSITTVVRL